MPRKHVKARSSGKRDTRNQVTISGTDYFDLSYSASFSSAYFSVKASAFDRASYIRQCFAEYRMERFHIQCLPSCTGPVAFGWVPGSTAGSPSGYTNVTVANLSPSVIWWNGQVAPVKMTVTHRNIGMNYRWQPTNDAYYAIGTLIIGGPASTAVTAKVFCSWKFTFRGPVDFGKFFLGADERRLPILGEEKESPEQAVMVPSFRESIAAASETCPILTKEISFKRVPSSPAS